MAIRYARRALYLIGVLSVCVIAASAFRLATQASASPSPFGEISAAASAPVLSSNAAVLAQMRDPATGVAIGGSDLTAVRQLPDTIASHAVYLMPSASGLCEWVEQFGGGCGPALSSSYPVLFSSFDPVDPGGSGTTAYGIAEDSVASITMTISGHQVTVPVKDNVFAFEAGPSVAPGDITSVSANFDDGHSFTLFK